MKIYNNKNELVNIKKGYLISTLYTGSCKNIGSYDFLLRLIKNRNSYYIGTYKNNYIIYKYFTNKKNAITYALKHKRKYYYNCITNSMELITKNVYIIYKYDKIKNDFIFIKEYATPSELVKDYHIKNIFQYTTDNLESIQKLLRDNYIIFKDKISIYE